MNEIRNIYQLSQEPLKKEIFEVLASGDVKIERIISTGQTTPEGQWYDQDTDEWVILLQGEAKLLFEDLAEIELKKGNYMLIKAHERHKVTYTSTEPPCIWLAVHGNLTLQ